MLQGSCTPCYKVMHHVQGLYTMYKAVHHVLGCTPCTRLYTMHKYRVPCTSTVYHVQGCASMYKHRVPCTRLYIHVRGLYSLKRPCFRPFTRYHRTRPFEGCSTVDQARFDWSARSDISRSGPPDLRTSGPSDMPLLAVVNPRLIYGRTALRRPCFRPSTRYHRTRPFEGCSTVDQARFDWSARSDTSRSG